MNVLGYERGSLCLTGQAVLDHEIDGGPRGGLGADPFAAKTAAGRKVRPAAAATAIRCRHVAGLSATNGSCLGATVGVTRFLFVARPAATLAGARATDTGAAPGAVRAGLAQGALEAEVAHEGVDDLAPVDGGPAVPVI